MMIELAALDNGAHRNQNPAISPLPEGWAVVPDSVEVPDTFPFVDITTEEVDGVITVTAMTAGTVPDVEPPDMETVQSEPTTEELRAQLEATQEILDALLMGEIET